MELIVHSSFSDAPGLRYCNLSEKSGEEFYHQLLNYAFKESLEKGEDLSVVLDYTDGYAPSFLDESFGNLVYDFGLKLVKTHLVIISNEEPFWVERIESIYNIWEERRKRGEEPIVTVEHDAWYRIVNNKFESKVWIHPHLNS